jgi:iron(III) transport system substrate-binding protein
MLRKLGIYAAIGWGAFSVSPFGAIAADWSQVVAKAKQEGLVVVHGGPGKSYAAALKTAFSKAYPDIKIQFSGARNSTDIPRLLRERQANIYAWDVWVSGPSTPLSRLKPKGIFQPFEQILRDDIKADKNWHDGFAAGWMDVEGKYFYAFDGTVQNPILVNWDFVKKSELTSIADLATPKFAGKIIWDDPRVGGSGNGSSLTLYENFGEEFLRSMYRQKIVYSKNRRQQAEWLVRGRYPISIGASDNDVAVFQRQGLGKNIGPLPDSYYKIQQVSAGFGGVGLVDKAPHPNAAAVYINWLLSKAGQTEWVKVPRVSRRVDVVSPRGDLMTKPGVKYFSGQAEKYQKTRRNLMKIAREIITAKMPERRKRGKKKKEQ